MPDGGGDYYSLARNREIRIHVHHNDLRVCETVCVALRIEGYHTSFSTRRDELTATLGAAPISAVIVGNDLLSDLHVLRRQRFGAPAIVIQESVDLDQALAAMRSGAVDVVALPLDMERLLRGLRGTLANRIRPIGSTSKVGGFAKLTERERQVLELIVEGSSNKEAGQALNISPRTIEVHRSRILEKTGSRNTAELVRKALT